MHFPSVPHDVDPMSVHWVAESGGMPLAIGVHVPTVPVRLQLWQAAEQAALQQTPCSQNPDVHCIAVVHAEPFDSCVQTLPMQLNPVAQSMPVVQLVLQFVAPHT